VTAAAWALGLPSSEGLAHLRPALASLHRARPTALEAFYAFLWAGRTHLTHPWVQEVATALAVAAWSDQDPGVVLRASLFTL